MLQVSGISHTSQIPNDHLDVNGLPTMAMLIADKSPSMDSDEGSTQGSVQGSTQHSIHSIGGGGGDSLRLNRLPSVPKIHTYNYSRGSDMELECDEVSDIITTMTTYQIEGEIFSVAPTVPSVPVTPFVPPIAPPVMSEIGLSVVPTKKPKHVKVEVVE